MSAIKFATCEDCGKYATCGINVNDRFHVAKNEHCLSFKEKKAK